MVDFEFPDIDEWQQAKTLLDQGGVGNLRHIAVTWNVQTYANRMGLSSWKTRMEDGGGTLYSFVSHVFYYLEWFAGSIRRLVCNLFRPLEIPVPVIPWLFFAWSLSRERLFLYQLAATHFWVAVTV